MNRLIQMPICGNSASARLASTNGAERSGFLPIRFPKISNRPRLKRWDATRYPSIGAMATIRGFTLSTISKESAPVRSARPHHPPELSSGGCSFQDSFYGKRFCAAEAVVWAGMVRTVIVSKGGLREHFVREMLFFIKGTASNNFLKDTIVR